MAEKMRTITTPMCRFCKKTGEVHVTESDYEKYGSMKQGHHIQDILPDLSADTREMLITGTHPECWASMFGSGDCD